jgi:hypothetical protein
MLPASTVFFWEIENMAGLFLTAGAGWHGARPLKSLSLQLELNPAIARDIFYHVF